MFSSAFTFGLFYVATGRKYLAEAISNAFLSKFYSPGVDIAICTDEVDLAVEADVFDKVLCHPEPTFGYRDKIPPLLNLPYDFNLFLDSDAFVCSPIDSLYELRKTIDIACSLAPVRHPPGWSDPKVPLFFPEYNSGVILIRKSRIQAQLIRRWLSLYDQLFLEFQQNWDQASLRSVLWHFLQNKKSFKFYQLPPEFNLRTPKPWVVGRGSPAYIIHGRFPSAEIKDLLFYLNGNIDRFRTSSDWLTLVPNSHVRPRFDNAPF